MSTGGRTEERDDMSRVVSGPGAGHGKRISITVQSKGDLTTVRGA